MSSQSVSGVWAWMNRVAKAIANDSSITSNSKTASGTTEKGEKYSIKVGDTLKVEYNGEERRVRVLGFKHDDLVNKGAYGGNHTKAGISFEFLDFMTGTDYMALNTSNTNTGGWASSKMRSDLNGTGSSIGGLGANLSNKTYIKQVKKIYNPTWSASSTSTTSNDYLWLLSCSEIWTSGMQSSVNYGGTKAKEGDQYQYYKGVVTGTGSNNKLVKRSSESGSEYDWWLRSVSGDDNVHFCRVYRDGSADRNSASVNYGVAPGFSI